LEDGGHFLRGADDQVIAHVATMSNSHVEADVRLLANAPQLLATLRRLHAAVQKVVPLPAGPINAPRHAGDDLEDALADAAAIIRQVDGEER